MFFVVSFVPFSVGPNSIGLIVSLAMCTNWIYYSCLSKAFILFVSRLIAFTLVACAYMCVFISSTSFVITLIDTFHRRHNTDRHWYPLHTICTYMWERTSNICWRRAIIRSINLSFTFDTMNPQHDRKNNRKQKVVRVFSIFNRNGIDLFVVWQLKSICNCS